MLSDLHDRDDGFLLEGDVCIVGAGAAGITLAREFSGAGARVLLLESGGLEFEPESQDLYQGHVVGHFYPDLDVGRLRLFGGTTNHWLGSCKALSPIDFAARPWVPYSGWPITLDELAPYYARAARLVQIEPDRTDEDIRRDLALEHPGIDPAVVDMFFLQHSAPTRFGEAYRDDLARAANVEVVLHANVTAVRTTPTAERVTHLEVATLDGRTGRARAGFYVLACGGMENPRLLLNSDSVRPHGLGNDRGLVGRFYIDRPRGKVGTVLALDTYKIQDTFNSRYRDDGYTYATSYALSEPLMRAHEALHASARFMDIPVRESGTAAAQQILRDLRNGHWPANLGDKILRVIGDLDHVAVNTWRAYVEDRTAIHQSSMIYLEAEGEQAPNPDSRIYLTPDRDRLGLRRIALDWRLSEIDRYSMLVLVRAMAAEFRRLGLGAISPDHWLVERGGNWQAELKESFHHIGTTRMADTPAKGVVDADCRLHGTDNLYLAGSSVFPTSGAVPPTYTIVSLAIRLADHLKQRLVAGPAPADRLLHTDGQDTVMAG